MKLPLYLLLLTMFTALSSFSQTDSVTVTNSPKDSIDAKYDRMYKLFIEDKKEIKHLWKIDLVSFSFTAPNIGFEQKIGKFFSSDTYFKAGYPKFEGNETKLFGIYFDEGIKYYFNLKRREVKGKRINGFSGDYFSVYFKYSYIESQYYSYNASKQFLYYEHKYGLYAGYGLQRRLGNIGYIEPYIRIGYAWETNQNFNFKGFSSSVGLKAGFAIDSFRNLKKYRNLR